MIRFLIAFIFLLPVTAFSQSENVVLIGIDGLGSYGIRRAETPVMDSLMLHGSYTLNAKAHYPTLSCPNWASMIKGVKPSKHRIKSNHWEQQISAKDRKHYQSYPSLFKVFKERSPSAFVAGFVQWKGFIPLVEEDLQAYFKYNPDEDSVIDQAKGFILEKIPDLTFIHLDLVDKAGHSYGVNSKEYKLAVEKADNLVGEFISAIVQTFPDEKFIFMVSSDHGFSGKHHGGLCPRTKRIPWIVSGYKIRPGYKIKSRVRIIDTPATIAEIFLLPVSEKWDGKVVREIFEEK